jgi:DNA/RNA endonuclease YhcR with UshA esterase domain
MKPKTLLVLLVGALVALASCQSTPNYKATEAARHVGESATVTDRVDGVQQLGKGNTFLNMGGKYPNQAFTAFIPSENAAQFPHAQQYKGRVVSVSGKITLHKGKPEIVVTSPAQISTK